MNSRCLPILFAAVFSFALVGCGSDAPRKIAEFPLDNLDGLLEASLAELSIDTETSHDGEGSLHFFSSGNEKRLLFDVPISGLHSREIVWRSRVKSQSLVRGLFFEIILTNADGSVRFKRIYCNNVSRFTDWAQTDAVLPLNPEDDPASIRLILYTGGAGHIWIDEIEIWDGLPPGYVAPETEPEE